MNGISSYSLWWIICQHDLYLRSGDIDGLGKQADALSELVERMSGYVADDGSETLPGFRFVDWPTSRDDEAVHAGLQALMRLAFHDAASLFDWLGNEAKAAFCRKVETKLCAAAVPLTRRKTAASLMAVSGMISPEEVTDKVLRNESLRDLSTFGGCYVLKAMAMAGAEADALELIRRYWGGMLDLGATTFWEDFDLAWADNASRIDRMPEEGKVDVHLSRGRFCYQGLRHSLCHGWASAPASFLPETLAGFTVLEPGCKRVKLAPRLAGLEWFSCRIPTPYGAISVEMSQKKAPRIEAPSEITVI